MLSNPPYVEDGAALAPEILRHEPRAALFAGADGREVIDRLIAATAASPARLLALEVGAGQAAGVAEAMRAAGFADTAIARDLAGIERVVSGRR